MFEKSDISPQGIHAIAGGIAPGSKQCATLTGSYHVFMSATPSGSGMFGDGVRGRCPRLLHWSPSATSEIFQTASKKLLLSFQDVASEALLFGRDESCSCASLRQRRTWARR